MPFPLKYLGFYAAKKDFNSAPGYGGAAHFKKGKLLQYQKTTNNIHGMMEIISFNDWNTKEPLIWHVDTNELYDRWQDYLEPAKFG